MAKFQASLSVVVLLLGLTALTAALAVEEEAKLEVKQPANIKVKIIDNSRVLTKEEVDKMVNNGKAPLQIVDPIVDHIAIDPVVVDEKKDEVAGKQPEQQQQDMNLKLDLPPIPPLLLPNIPDVPPFLQNIFGTNDDQADTNANNNKQQQSAVDGQMPQDDKPKGIINVIMVKASNKLDDAENGVKSSFVIFKFLPKPLNHFFGLNDNDNDDDDDDNDDDDDPEKTGLDTNSEKQGQKILGGDDDPDKKRIHLLGGGGENDPDRIRFRLDNDRGVFTGGDDLLINTQPIEQHHYFIFSMIDRIRNMFSQMGTSQSTEDGGERSVEEEQPFIIRTDDGTAAILPNDIGYAEKQQQSLNKCMMLNFMRLKASMYYRTILHLLFFTGVLLFVLSLTMLTVRTYKRRRYVRQPINVATIETGGKGGSGEKNKMNLYRAWNSGAFDYQSSAIGGADSKTVLIQAPPAYDQVIINDRTSSLTSQSVSSRLLSNNKSTSDECETKSLPPEYEQTVTNNNNN